MLNYNNDLNMYFILFSEYKSELTVDRKYQSSLIKIFYCHVYNDIHATLSISLFRFILKL